MAVQLGYVLYFFLRIFSFGHRPVPAVDPSAIQPVSVIICARNEARNLERNLPAILAQRYTNGAGKMRYEVIVVNDASDDDTEQVLQMLEQQYEHLRHVTIAPGEERDKPGKKYALSRGVEQANHSLLVMTDADCMPAGENWLRHMTVPLHNGKQIVAGYGAYYTHNGLLNAFIRWETMHTFLQYSTYARAGRPYMAVGRNMACTKDIFLQAQQSTIWNELPSGDDDLLMATMATGQNTAIVANEDAFTYSESQPGWKSWIRQKQRHLSTGKYYKPAVRNLLGIYALSHAGMWLSFLVLLFFCWQTAVLIMAVRCLCYWAVWTKAATLLREGKLVFLFPLLDIGWMLYNFAFAPYIIWKNKQQWK